MPSYSQIFGMVKYNIYICNKVMIIAKRLDAQYQQYNKTIQK